MISPTSVLHFGKVALAATCVFALAGPAQSDVKPSKTMSFVITRWDVGILETKFIDECPEGFTIGNDELWLRSMPKSERVKKPKDRSGRYPLSLLRGPNGENVCFNPTVVTDPPLKTIEGKVAYGMNLDGTTDGHATAKTCAHEKFTGVDGTPAVDNQLYRTIGCIYGWHSYGQIQDNANANRRTTGFAISIVEVSGVDDPRNDADVTVNIYHAVDQYVLDAQGQFMPFASYRVDTRDGKAAYAKPVHGKIVDGVLTTDPSDTVLPWYGNYTFMDQRFRDFTIRLEIAKDGKTAKGLAAGYYDIDQLMYYMASIGQVAYSGQSNCPGIYVAAHKLADGYPDPKTGECQALSSAYNFQAVAAFAVHPDSETKQASVPLRKLRTMFGMDG